MMKKAILIFFALCLTASLFAFLSFSYSSNKALGEQRAPEGKKHMITKYFVPVAHVYTTEDNFISSEQNIYTYASYPKEALDTLTTWYPQIIKVDDPMIFLDEDTKNVALIDAEDLSYKQKLLYFDGKYFLEDISGSIQIDLTTEDPFESSFDKAKLGTINQTGVTALTRGLAEKTDASGDFGYPAKNIADFLKNADITHISNEVSFVPGCAYVAYSSKFCAKPEYMQALKDIGADIIELTGNHNNDYGSNYNASTIEKYSQLGMRYFGGGLNIEDAKKILYENIKGTRVAFLGYNYYDTMLKTDAIAKTNSAGSNSYSQEKIKNDIAEARKSADFVIVDIQFEECYSYPKTNGAYLPCYKPLAYPDQVSIFRKAIDDGADIVVGTQAHQPQTYELYNGKLIFYGLGNLFFDQIRWEGTRQGIILTHYLYGGKLIQTKLTTTNYGSDMQTRITKGMERGSLLEILKQVRIE